MKLLPLVLICWLCAGVTPLRAEPFRFPPGFLWGTATSAHQVEGGNSGNDWWAWEQVPGHVRNNDRSGQACDHYARFSQDLSLARQMGHNSYRFSIEWARLEPRPGEFDEAEVAHYRAVLEACRANGLTPMVTLFHFTLPKWVADRGGWENPETVRLFSRFSEFAGHRFGDLADWWCTLNEPVVYLGAGWVKGVFPPQKQDWRLAFKVMANLARGHVESYRALKRSDRVDADADSRASLVSIADHLRVFDPARGWNPLDQVAARVADYLFNRAFLKAITKGRLQVTAPQLPHVNEVIAGGDHCLDYLGVNYYSRDLIKFDPRAPGAFQTTLPEGAPVNDLGWELYPEGFYRVLMDAWRRYKLPIVVTENGLADAADTRRVDFLRTHLQAMARAMQDGVPVLGYMHWSLMDNFEWAEGFAPRFGLLSVDYATQERRPTKAAVSYSQIIRQGVIDLPSESESWEAPAPLEDDSPRGSY